MAKTVRELPVCSCGEPATVTLQVISRQAPEGEEVKVCLACADKLEAVSDENPTVFSKRLHVEPVVGMPCTVGIGSDSYPYTVVAVTPTGKSITVQRNRHKAAPGHNHYGEQKYIYLDELEGEPEVWTLRKDGRWRPLGASKGSGFYICLGFRRAYSDPHR